MNRKIITAFKIIFVIFSLFAIVRGFYLVYENSELKHKLSESESNRDRFYGQLNELSFIMLELNEDVSKKKLYDSIYNFRQKMYDEFKQDSIQTYDLSLPFNEKENIIHGYHDELIFSFENGKLVEINFGDFKPNYRRLN